MNDTALLSQNSSRHSRLAEVGWLLFAVLAGPVAWGLQLLINYALASYPCFPRDVPRVTVAPGWQGAWSIILTLNIIAALLALAGAVISHRKWRAARHEQINASSTREAESGRTRFLALCGVMTGCGFLVAIIFNTISVFMVPQCVG